MPRRQSTQRGKRLVTHGGLLGGILLALFIAGATDWVATTGEPSVSFIACLGVGITASAGFVLYGIWLMLQGVIHRIVAEPPTPKTQQPE